MSPVSYYLLYRLLSTVCSYACTLYVPRDTTRVVMSWSIVLFDISSVVQCLLHFARDASPSIVRYIRPVFESPAKYEVTTCNAYTGQPSGLRFHPTLFSIFDYSRLKYPDICQYFHSEEGIVLPQLDPQRHSSQGFIEIAALTLFSGSLAAFGDIPYHPG